ncbi:MAG: alpha/beta hydrolase, partial [Patescibacteria group bacterium]
KGIVFVHGFERTTVERKFKIIIDKLKDKISLFRFDFSGCGLSDGDFTDFTIKKSANELKFAIDAFVNETKVEEIILISHSVGACVVLEYLKQYSDKKINKIVFLAPALNQKQLHRYWFTKSTNKDVEVTWENHNKYLDEKGFLKFTEIPERMSKEHWISNEYWLENRERNYNEDLDILPSEVFVVHGENDDKVPMQSNSLKVNILVKKGDHDIQRPDMLEQYIDQLIGFIL